MIPFSKPAESLSALYAKMAARGLGVSTPADLQTALENIGYYRLGGYAYPFLIPPDREVFKSGTTWEQIARIYEFDRELRLLVSDAVERIEVGLRARLISATTTAALPTDPAAPVEGSTPMLPVGTALVHGPGTFPPEV
jgi:abortive infection bacteriophage resistance protein